VLNLIVLTGIARVLRDMRGGSCREQELETQLQARGLMYPVLRPVHAVCQPQLAALFSSG